MKYQHHPRDSRDRNQDRDRPTHAGRAKRDEVRRRETTQMLRWGVYSGNNDDAA